MGSNSFAFRRFVISGLVAATTLMGCTTPAADERTAAPLAGPAVPRPFTDRFLGEAWLVARAIEVEGPLGLLDHIAAGQDTQSFDYRAESIPAGYRQTWTRRADAVNGLRAQLDGWALVATDRLVVLERFDEVSVTLRAAGDVTWFERATETSGGPATEHSVVGHRPGTP